MISIPKEVSKYVIDSGDDVETSDEEPDLNIDEAVGVATETVVDNGHIGPNKEKSLEDDLARMRIRGSNSSSQDQLSNPEEKPFYKLPPPPAEMYVPTYRIVSW